MTPALTVVGVWIAAFLTLTIFSFLFKDNSVYKFAEHLVVGLSAGYWLVILVQNVFMDLLFNPLKADVLSGAILLAPVQEGAGKGGNGLLLDLIPIVLGAMMWLRFFPKTAWWSRIPIAYVLGSGAGLAIPTALQTFIVAPLSGTLTLPVVPTSWQAWITGLVGGTMPPGEPIGFWAAMGNLLIVAGVFCGIVYFFFSKEHRGVTGKAANFGIWVLMVGFGSTFGFTVMSRVSLLVGRFEFLINTWLIANLWRLIFPASAPPP